MKLSEFTVTGNLLTLDVRSEIRQDRFKTICRDMDRAVEALGKVRLVLVMRHYPSFNSAEDFYDDLRFLRLYDHAIDKVAVVCDRRQYPGNRDRCANRSSGRAVTMDDHFGRVARAVKISGQRRDRLNLVQFACVAVVATEFF